MTDEVQTSDAYGEESSRRDFLYLAALAAGAGLGGAFAWPLIDSMNPAADVLALSSIEVDIGPIEEGQGITVKWRGKPVFIRHRTADEIAQARADDAVDLPDRQPDADRVQRPEWLIMVGVCTHLGCIPLGQKTGDPKGEFGGWFCPCHGSHYDTAGRIRKGPAPENLAVPVVRFDGETEIVLG